MAYSQESKLFAYLLHQVLTHICHGTFSELSWELRKHLGPQAVLRTAFSLQYGLGARQNYLSDSKLLEWNPLLAKFQIKRMTTNQTGDVIASHSLSLSATTEIDDPLEEVPGQDLSRTTLDWSLSWPWSYKSVSQPFSCLCSGCSRNNGRFSFITKFMTSVVHYPHFTLEICSASSRGIDFDRIVFIRFHENVEIISKFHITSDFWSPFCTSLSL